MIRKCSLRILPNRQWQQYEKKLVFLVIWVKCPLEISKQQPLNSTNQILFEIVHGLNNSLLILKLMFTREMISNTDETLTVKPMFLRFSSVYKKQEKNEYILLREVKLNFYDLMLRLVYYPLDKCVYPWIILPIHRWVGIKRFR